MPGEIRRVVTTHDATGKAIVLFDGDSPHKMTRGQHTTSRMMWRTDGAPAEMDVKRDVAGDQKGIQPPKNGSVFRFVDFAPMGPEVDKLDVNTMAHAVGDHGATKKYRAPTHPFMHRTQSVDYAIIVSGEIDMLLDDSTVHLKAGDVVIQQGTNHAWVNRGKEPCRIAFVLVDAKDE